MGKSECLLCHKSMTSGGIHAHYFSSIHMADLQVNIAQRKKSYEAWKERYLSNKTNTPFSLQMNSKPPLYICLYCKICSKSDLHRCEHKDANIELFEDLLSKTPQVQDVEDSPFTQFEKRLSMCEGITRDLKERMKEGFKARDDEIKELKKRIKLLDKYFPID